MQITVHVWCLVSAIYESFVFLCMFSQIIVKELVSSIAVGHNEAIISCVLHLVC